MTSGLARFYAFFETWGKERLDGLDASHFRNLTDSEKEEAWHFLEKNLAFSVESTCGLYLINPERAVEKFKEQVQMPLAENVYPAERRAQEENRTLMLHFIFSRGPAPEYVEILNGFASSEFEEIRAKFSDYLPSTGASNRSLALLKEIIFTETNRIARSCAIRKFLAIYGYNFEVGDEHRRVLYQALASGNEGEKSAAIQQIENEHRVR